MFVLIIILAQSFTVAAPLLEAHVVTELVVLVLQHKRAKAILLLVIAGSCCSSSTSSTSPTLLAQRGSDIMISGDRISSIGFHVGLDLAERSSDGLLGFGLKQGRTS